MRQTRHLFVAEVTRVTGLLAVLGPGQRNLDATTIVVEVRERVVFELVVNVRTTLNGSLTSAPIFICSGPVESLGTANRSHCRCSPDSSSLPRGSVCPEARVLPVASVRTQGSGVAGPPSTTATFSVFGK